MSRSLDDWAIDKYGSIEDARWEHERDEYDEDSRGESEDSDDV